MTITLATLEQATEQEVFDQVARHLLTQGYKSETHDYDSPIQGCLYRGPNGAKCAAGILMSDDEWKSYWEGCDWQTLIEQNEVPSSHYNFIWSLQYIHDTVSPEQWKWMLKVEADSRKLNTTVLDEFN